ncbi:MAG: AMP-binding protein [Chloroflexi bacterium]|jgi:malonyl-CoA/methylmalonyl-CoA synthetase|nr:AMP-binding protein [Chloroflexota bacterium]
MTGPTFLERLHALCERQPDKVALIFLPEEGDGERLAERQAITYGELERLVRRGMAFLQAKGVEKGDRVALQLPKSLPFIILHLAVMRLEAISLPLNPGYPPRELLYFLDDAQAKLFFAADTARSALSPLLADLGSLEETIYLDTANGAALAALLAPYDPAQAASLPIPQERDATCLMIYTSGTTGRPKGAELTHGNLTANLDALHEAWGWREDDVLLHVLPIFHVHGLIVALHGALHAGATALLLPSFDARRTLQLLQDERCTVFMGVPAIHRRLVEVEGAAGYDLSHMRLLTSGSDRLPDDLFHRFRETFGHTLLERYGMSETGMLISNPLHGERRVGSVGLPLPGVEVRIVDPETEAPLPDGEVGAVQVRGANVCKGYWRQPEKTAEAFTADGWLRTGDLGLREPDGYITLKGRSKDLVISGGYNVYPPEVELVLASHPAVAASAVIGCPDPQWGERVTAVIVPKAGSAPTAREIIAYCRERLVSYKAPRQVIFVEALPRNALGKVQKAALRETICG